MIEILPESEPGALAVVITGAMTEDDHQTLAGELHLRADRDEDFDLILEMRDAEGLDAGTIRQEFELANKFSDDIRRLAVVTDGGAWEGIAAVFGKPIGQALGIEVEHFSDRTAAWRWFFNS